MKKVLALAIVATNIFAFNYVFAGTGQIGSSDENQIENQMPNLNARARVTCRAKFKSDEAMREIKISAFNDNGRLYGAKTFKVDSKFHVEVSAELSTRGELFVNMNGSFRNSENDFWKQAGEHGFLFKLEDSGREAILVKKFFADLDFNQIESCKVDYYN